ncbi:hypothetical protein [Mesorhizobium sp. KR2-14]
MTGANGHAQLVQLTLQGARGDERKLRPLDVPEAYTGIVKLTGG